MKSDLLDRSLNISCEADMTFLLIINIIFTLLTLLHPPSIGDRQVFIAQSSAYRGCCSGPAGAIMTSHIHTNSRIWSPRYSARLNEDLSVVSFVSSSKIWVIFCSEQAWKYRETLPGLFDRSGRQRRNRYSFRQLDWTMVIVLCSVFVLPTLLLFSCSPTAEARSSADYFYIRSVWSYFRRPPSIELLYSFCIARSSSDFPT